MLSQRKEMHKFNLYNLGPLSLINQLLSGFTADVPAQSDTALSVQLVVGEACRREEPTIKTAFENLSSPIRIL